MSDKRGNIVLRFGIIYVLIVLAFVAVLIKVVQIKTVDRQSLVKFGNNKQQKIIEAKPMRGNIYSADGQLLSSSIPIYDIFMDTRVPALHPNPRKKKKNETDSAYQAGYNLLEKNIDSLSFCLSRLFKDRTATDYKTMITNAYNRGTAELKLYPRKIPYNQLKELKTFPLFRLGRTRSGLIPKENVQRVKFFGSLASRTIGDVYPDQARGGKNGLELYFDKTLQGKPGISVYGKIANTWMQTVEKEAIRGNDIITTIDVGMQDLAETALRDALSLYQPESGYAILMETKSGEIKAIVNLQQNTDGSYSENVNGAVRDKVEPGSTFKTVSIMAAVDEGLISLKDTIVRGNGTYNFGGGAIMRDHNEGRGAAKITVEQAIMNSSNVGVSRAIVKAYGKNPNRFIDKLHQMGIEDSLKIEMYGTAAPHIPHPSDKQWSHISLPWMSVGYEVQIPPIYTLTFYNAIANGGKMVRPIFVKAISSNGKIIKTFETETVRSQICSKETLEQIKKALLGVVHDKQFGTAKAAQSNLISISGKTGTAQISKGAAGYKAGGKEHQVSFCGYFPSENPQYTCIVVLRKPQGVPSGGTMAGAVVKKIAEEVMAMNMQKTPQEMISDSLFIAANWLKMPKIKNGNFPALKNLTKILHFSLDGEGEKWTVSKTDSNKIEVMPLKLINNLVPNVEGMGARDAVYLMENSGLQVLLSGRGKVFHQSIPPGTRAVKGAIVTLSLGSQNLR